MTPSELIISLVPLVVVLAAALLVIRRTGAFEQWAHRQKVEALLERIANAVERNKD